MEIKLKEDKSVALLEIIDKGDYFAVCLGRLHLAQLRKDCSEIKVFQGHMRKYFESLDEHC